MSTNATLRAALGPAAGGGGRHHVHKGAQWGGYLREGALSWNVSLRSYVVPTIAPTYGNCRNGEEGSAPPIEARQAQEEEEGAAAGIPVKSFMPFIEFVNLNLNL